MSTFTPEEVAKLAAAGNEVRANLQANFKGTLPDVECVAACEARFSDCSA